MTIPSAFDPNTHGGGIALRLGVARLDDVQVLILPHRKPYALVDLSDEELRENLDQHITHRNARQWTSGDRGQPLDRDTGVTELVRVALDSQYQQQECPDCDHHPDSFTHQDTCVTPRIQQRNDLAAARTALSRIREWIDTHKHILTPEELEELEAILKGTTP
ncbi:hypothetical protein SEA_CAFASSO_68 [Gordonia phage Cafasso]|uniref:Uncharacterized protein n=1 Tax=Gordonia phage Cafasso TaxID=2851095 RepID=A0AAE7VCF4_9CAUD|nr:hypothetical protein SEA_CAFASSO_68 [Gordonia phage Cafasso]